MANLPAIRSSIQTTVLFILFTGMRFALMQVKTGLCHILSRFVVAPCQDTPVPVAFNTKAVVLEMHGNVRLSFKKMQF
jgi:cytochrome P450 family 6